jgi:alpha-L-arabinofuranosidase
VFLTPNYYVQQLFGQNAGDESLPTTLEGADEPARLAASTVRDSKSGDVIVKLVNGADEPAKVAIKIAGLAEGELQATRTVLTGEGADSFNKDGEPPAVKPVAAEVTLSSDFEYEAPGNSLTVFRLRK